MQDKTLKERLDHINQFRSGHITASIIGAETAMKAVKNCPICRNPSPMLSDSRFACKKCLVIYS